ncbi:hypothetical protein RYX36_011151 [Vicia faba]
MNGADKVRAGEGEMMNGAEKLRAGEGEMEKTMNRASNLEEEEIQMARHFMKRFYEEHDRHDESLMKDGFLDESYKNDDCGSNYIPKDVSRKCAKEEHDSIKPVDVEAGKGYKCVIHRDIRDLFEIKIGHRWYKYARDSSLEVGDELFCSVTPYFKRDDCAFVETLCRG